MKLQKWLALAALVTSFGFVYPSRAQDDDTGDDRTRGVARVSVIQGQVNLKRGDSGEIVAAALNAPLLSQDHLQTAEGSLAEVQFDYANMVRLAPDTDLGFADVRYHHYQVQLGAGTVMYRVLRDANSDAEIDTPSISVRPLGRGEYRITVREDGTTEVTVRSGRAEIFSPGGSQQISAGTTMLVRGAQSDPEFQEEAAIPRDQFDDWNHSRDNQLLRSRSYRYVASDVYGAEDLDDYGTWVPSEYGTVWQPRVVPGWAPYRAGRWVWEDYYGWTWVSYDPWGWAPYHYGRWFYNGGAGWCWWPGAIGHPRFWRPALVAFFGFGRGGFGLSFGFGNVGWLPLAPFEPWHPWYGRGFYEHGWGSYGNRTVIVNNTNIYNVYRNARINNGVTYTTITQFGRGASAFNGTSGAQLRQANLVRGGLPIAPNRESLAFSNRPAIINSHLASVDNRQFFAHQRPAVPERVPFAQQQAHMAEVQQRTLGIRPSNISYPQSQYPQRGTPPGSYSQRQMSGTNNAGALHPAISGTQPAPATNGGWRRMGDVNARAGEQGIRSNPHQNGGFHSYSQAPAARESTAVSPQTQNAQQSAGWHRFGQSQAQSQSMYSSGSRGFGNSPPGRSNQAPMSSGADSSGWHRFGATPQPVPRQEGGMNYSRPQYSEPQTYSRPNYGGYRGEAPRSEPLRLTQPMVRERPNYESSRPYGYGAPRESAPHYSAPAYRSSGGGYSAPSGGAGHSSGGGGGHSAEGGHRR
jgi:hypothetical protein